VRHALCHREGNGPSDQRHEGVADGVHRRGESERHEARDAVKNPP
jgi:hypothetical protein